MANPRNKVKCSYNLIISSNSVKNTNVNLCTCLLRCKEFLNACLQCVCKQENIFDYYNIIFFYIEYYPVWGKVSNRICIYNKRHTDKQTDWLKEKRDRHTHRQTDSLTLIILYMWYMYIKVTWQMFNFLLYLEIWTGEGGGGV